MLRFLNEPSVPEIQEALIERQFNSFLTSYALYRNHKYDRTGGTFQRPMKRIAIDDETHLQQAIIYCNANAQKHNMVDDFKTYPFSSYRDVIEKDNRFIALEGILKFFGDINKFIGAHQAQVEYY